MFLALKRIRLSKEEGREETRAELQPQLDAAVATATQAHATATQVETMKAENQLLRERQSLRDEEIRLLRERLAQRENGAGNGNDD